MEENMKKYMLVRNFKSELLSRHDIHVHSDEGGVGKTTLAVHFAIYLHDLGKRVALLDSEPTATAAKWVTEAEAKIRVVHVTGSANSSEALQELHDSYDYIVCDTPGGDNETIRTLMLLVDVAVFPVGPSILELRSLNEAASIIKIAQRIRGGRPEARIVCNMVKKKGVTSRELPEAAAEFGIPVASSKVRELERFRDAPQEGTTVNRMGMSMAQIDIELLFEELLAIGQPKSNESPLEVANG
jgi:chromosome partitioning protein